MRTLATVFMVSMAAAGNVSAACLSQERFIEENGQVCQSGNNYAMASVGQQLIPKGWVMQFEANEIEPIPVSFQEGLLWVDNLDAIGKAKGMSFIVDGAEKTVIATYPDDILGKGAVVINSQVKRARELYQMTSRYARLSDGARLKREIAKSKSRVNAPLVEVNDVRDTMISVEDAVFDLSIYPGILEESIKAYFMKKWNYGVVVEKYGFVSAPKLNSAIQLNGDTVQQDVDELTAILDGQGNIQYEFEVYGNTEVLHLKMTKMGGVR